MVDVAAVNGKPDSKMQKSSNLQKSKTAISAKLSTWDMVKSALTALKTRSGSSRAAIVKYITQTYKVTANARFNGVLRRTLNTQVENGSLGRTGNTFKFNSKPNVNKLPRQQKTKRELEAPGVSQQKAGIPLTLSPAIKTSGITTSVRSRAPSKMIKKTKVGTPTMSEKKIKKTTKQNKAISSKSRPIIGKTTKNTKRGSNPLKNSLVRGGALKKVIKKQTGLKTPEK